MQNKLNKNMIFLNSKDIVYDVHKKGAYFWKCGQNGDMIQKLMHEQTY